VLLRSAEPEAIALAVAPEAVLVTDVLALVRDPELAAPHLPARGADPVSSILEARIRAEREALGGLTLRSMIGEPDRHAAPPVEADGRDGSQRPAESADPTSTG
jgi:hypothetical protein